MQYDDDGILNLACAIVECAREDILMNINDKQIKTRARRDELICNKVGAIRFFHSDWYSTLTLGRNGHDDYNKIMHG